MDLNETWFDDQPIPGDDALLQNNKIFPSFDFMLILVIFHVLDLEYFMGIAMRWLYRFK